MNKARTTKSRTEDVTLTPAMFGILLALASSERHGLGIIEEVERRTQGETTLAIGTLYRSIARMCEDGLIAPARRRPVQESDDPHRNYYRVTDRGRHALAREVQRLDRLVRWARVLRALPRPV
jgi:DNA-binding PadR family transcriptional regulator